MRDIVTDGTAAYMIQGNALQKVNTTTGATTSISVDKEFKALTFGNAVLYGVTQAALYSIDTTTGVATLIATIADIDSISYLSTTVLVATRANSLLKITSATGVYTYLSNSIQ